MFVGPTGLQKTQKQFLIYYPPGLWTREQTETPISQSFPARDRLGHIENCCPRVQILISLQLEAEILTFGTLEVLSILSSTENR